MLNWSQRAAWVRKTTHNCLERLIMAYGETSGSSSQVEDGNGVASSEHSDAQSPAADGMSCHAGNDAQRQASVYPGGVSGMVAQQQSSSPAAVMNGMSAFSEDDVDSRDPQQLRADDDMCGQSPGHVPGNTAIQIPGNGPVPAQQPAFGQMQPRYQASANIHGMLAPQSDQLPGQAAQRSVMMGPKLDYHGGPSWAPLVATPFQNLGYQHAQRYHGPPPAGMSALDNSFDLDRFQGYCGYRFPDPASTTPAGPSPPLSDEQAFSGAVSTDVTQQRAGSSEKEGEDQEKNGTRKPSPNVQPDKSGNPRKDSEETANKQQRKKRAWPGPPFLKKPNPMLTPEDWRLLFAVGAECNLRRAEGVQGPGGGGGGNSNGRRITENQVLAMVLEDARVQARNIKTRYVPAFTPKHWKRERARCKMA
ncbi:hypothetical protein VUR80DRAFT_9636 [Thermomyces stellatus]